MYPTEIRTAPETVLAAVTHTGPYYEIGSAFSTLVDHLQKADIWKGSGPSFALYYDDPSQTPAENLRSHAAQRLAEGVDVPDGLERLVLEAGRFVVCTHTGAYSGLPDAWAYAYSTAVPESGSAFRDAVPFERYISNSWDTLPEDRVTEIWIPVV